MICPRCRQRLALYRDEYGDVKCWACGWTKYPPPEPYDPERDKRERTSDGLRFNQNRRVKR